MSVWLYSFVCECGCIQNPGFRIQPHACGWMVKTHACGCIHYPKTQCIAARCFPFKNMICINLQIRCNLQIPFQTWDGLWPLACLDICYVYFNFCWISHSHRWQEITTAQTSTIGFVLSQCQLRQFSKNYSVTCSLWTYLDSDEQSISLCAIGVHNSGTSHTWYKLLDFTANLRLHAMTCPL